ncbi:hypothetical protein IWQ60_007520 [Tieghemiomyces parasiticus]|uniref:Major facilitator superfamily (MFS) profile domain-containing protein n=1 Tax=Tieghemiomyces parasiticus TaxID=78921 RepID=A0A9W8A0R2_9FUNG|nr:hypothetical protein IWQ60_007520 [Tieghemiomyces parasiticus]
MGQHSSPGAGPSGAVRSRLIRHIFIALLLDILAFTTILPILPRLLQAYQDDGGSPVLAWFIGSVNGFKAYLTGQPARAEADTVLVGGLLGSLFSLLQFLVAPVIGRLADRFGRRPVLLICLAGNILASVVWLGSRRFEMFLVARVLAGLSEGNVQLSHAMIADITPPAGRSRGMAWVGIAFATGFTLGPPLGAYFASLNPTGPVGAQAWFGSASPRMAPYPLAAVFTLVLLGLEFLYIYAYIPETIGLGNHTKADTAPATVPASVPPSAAPNAETAAAIDVATESRIRDLEYIHLLYLFAFSGMEFTLPFLTFEKFQFTHMQQGQFLGLIGILSTIFQGAVVRRVAHRWGEKTMVSLGMFTCALGFVTIAFGAEPSAAVAAGHQSAGLPWGLYLAAVCLAITSATVVNCMTALVSILCSGGNRVAGADLDTAETDAAWNARKGQVLGDFRSLGQLGRASGPVVACTIYWLKGSAFAYAVGSVYIAAVLMGFHFKIQQPQYAKPKVQ